MCLAITRPAAGSASVFLPVAGRYVESLRLRPRVDEKFAYLDFGMQVAMFGRCIAIQAVGRPTFESVATEGIVAASGVSLAVRLMRRSTT
jgi:hypothetical protein